MYFILMILGGMKHPCISTALGLLYNVTRFFYFKGYSTGDPMKRLTIGFDFFFFPLVDLTTKPFQLVTYHPISVISMLQEIRFLGIARSHDLYHFVWCHSHPWLSYSFLRLLILWVCSLTLDPLLVVSCPQTFVIILIFFTLLLA